MENVEPTFELFLQVDFPEDVIFIEPPIPLEPNNPITPKTESELGEIYFYFSVFDEPIDTGQGVSQTSVSTFYVHFIPNELPSSVEELFTTPNHKLAHGLINDHDSRVIELKKLRGFFIRNPEPTEERERRFQIEAQLTDRYKELEQESEALCTQIFQNHELSSYFTKLGNTLLTATQNFLEILRHKYHQYLIPDRAAIQWSSGHWLLLESALSHESKKLRNDNRRGGVIDAGGTDFAPGMEERVRRVAKAFLNRILPYSGSRWEPGATHSVQPSDWADIARQIRSDEIIKTDLTEVLIATAISECDPHMGNPRLGLIEAVVALEVEVKSLMKNALEDYGISDNAIERIVRETPLADLTSVWIRREIPEELQQEFDNSLFDKCALAIHERNLLIHRRRRNISREKALEYVNTIAELLQKFRRFRKGK